MEVYKILTQDEWRMAQSFGLFHGSPIDVRDGFIHLSKKDQVAETLRLHFKGQTQLILLGIKAGHLDQLRWEKSRNGELFPHLYRSLQISECTDEWSLINDHAGIPLPPWESTR
jgi:uncharacterized protein (DUF952 family)